MPRTLLPTAASCLGIVLFVFLLLDEAKSEQLPPNGCPPLPEHASPNVVSLYVAKAIDVSGVVCARVINGFSEDLIVGGSSLRLERWQKEKWWRQGGFHPFAGTPPEDVIIGMTLVRTTMPAKGIRDERLPLLGSPAPAGRYRICFSYELLRQPSVQVTICSEEFVLP
jgi:hypothetical protein